MTTKEKDLLGLAQATSHYSAQVAEKYRDRYPDLDLRLLFQDDGFLTTAANRVAKSRVRNSEWAEGVGIPHAICGRDGRNIPEAWIK